MRTTLTACIWPHRNIQLIYRLTVNSGVYIIRFLGEFLKIFNKFLCHCSISDTVHKATDLYMRAHVCERVCLCHKSNFNVPWVKAFQSYSKNCFRAGMWLPWQLKEAVGANFKNLLLQNHNLHVALPSTLLSSCVC